MARRRRYSKSEDDTLDRLLGAIFVMVILLVGSLWYSNRAAFYEWLVGIIVVGVVLIAVAFWILILTRKKKEQRFDSLISQLEQSGKDDEIDNFINRFRYEKGGSFKYLDYSFTQKRLEDLSKILIEAGVKLKKGSEISDLYLILRYYIDIKEEKITRGSISANNGQEEFSKLPASGTDFELLLVRLYEAMGYTVQHTGKAGDQGADLIANKNGERILIQAKRYINTTPGNSSVQQPVAAMKLYDCNKSVLISTSDGFTREATELAKANNTELISKDRLSELLLQYLHESWR